MCPEHTKYATATICDELDQTHCKCTTCDHGDMAAITIPDYIRRVHVTVNFSIDSTPLTLHEQDTEALCCR